MLHLLTYPLDVMKTNRILQTNLALECEEFAPKEIVALFERGGLQHGAMRGLSMSLLLAAAAQAQTFDNLLLATPVLTLAQGPFNVLQVHRQAVSPYGHMPSYWEQVKQIGPARLFTLGFAPTLLRNGIILAAFAPLDRGYVLLSPTTALVALSAIFLSHPFEVARVQVQYRTKTGLFGDPVAALKATYAEAGVAGLYRGLIPRTLTMAPLMFAWLSYRQYAGLDENISTFRTKVQFE